MTSGSTLFSGESKAEGVCQPHTRPDVHDKLLTGIHRGGPGGVCSLPERRVLTCGPSEASPSRSEGCRACPHDSPQGSALLSWDCHALQTDIPRAMP